MNDEHSREGGSSPIPTPRAPSRVMRLNSRKDLRIRLEQNTLPSSPASPGGSSSCSSSRGGFSRSCTASPIPTPGSASPNAPSSPRSTCSSGSPNYRVAGPVAAAAAAAQASAMATPARKLSLMAEELEGIRNIYLSPPPSPKLFFNINPQNTWEAFKWIMEWENSPVNISPAPAPAPAPPSHPVSCTNHCLSLSIYPSFFSLTVYFSLFLSVGLSSFLSFLPFSIFLSIFLLSYSYKSHSYITIFEVF